MALEQFELNSNPSSPSPESVPLVKKSPVTLSQAAKIVKSKGKSAVKAWEAAGSYIISPNLPLTHEYIGLVHDLFFITRYAYIYNRPIGTVKYLREVLLQGKEFSVAEQEILVQSSRKITSLFVNPAIKR